MFDIKKNPKNKKNTESYFIYYLNYFSLHISSDTLSQACP